MLWNNNIAYHEEPFEYEADLEQAVKHVAHQLFGSSRIYLDVKKRIGSRGKIQNVPDGYLVDLTSNREPKLFVVENELAVHEPLRHVAAQVLEFSLSFETNPYQVKTIVKNALSIEQEAMQKCQQYAERNGFNNIDQLLDEMIFGTKKFNAIVIIDELSDELEKILTSRFQFPVEVLTIERYVREDGQRLYQFEPFLADVVFEDVPDAMQRNASVKTIDPSELDTIVVPARDDGFDETFLKENRWFAIRIHSSMIPKIKYIAAYRVKPHSAITHVAPVLSIERWKDTSKYVVNFSSPAEQLNPIKLETNGRVKPPQAPRYTSYSRLKNAQTLDDVF
jgi:hypothetical protein